jgi:hypothetical protein
LAVSVTGANALLQSVFVLAVIEVGFAILAGHVIGPYVVVVLAGAVPEIWGTPFTETL